MQVDWRKPWCPVQDDAIEESLRAELAREVPRGHVLHGVAAARAIGYREDQDDVAYLLPDGRVAIVHLTWARRPATPPNDPTTDLLDSIDAFGRAVEQDHEGWVGSPAAGDGSEGR